MVTPDGFISYVSLVDTGNTHDATAWNTAYAFPPLDENGMEREDKVTLLKDLEKTYGCGKPESQGSTATLLENTEEIAVDNIVLEEKDFTFAIGGDKAYPHILLNEGWSLFVTMTAGEEDAVKEAVQANEVTEELFTVSGKKCPKFVHTIYEEP